MFFHFSKLIKEDYEKTDWQWFYKFFQNLFLDRKFLTKNWRVFKVVVNFSTVR